MNAVVEALRGSKSDTGLDFEELDELSRYSGRIRKVYEQFESDMKAPNAEIYKYEIPGDFTIKKSSFVILATPVMPLYLPCQCR